jgi:hypothetical protein
VTAGIVADVEQLAGRLQSSERLLRREVEDYKNDPSAGASQGLCSIKVCGAGASSWCTQYGLKAEGPWVFEQSAVHAGPQHSGCVGFTLVITAAVSGQG